MARYDKKHIILQVKDHTGLDIFIAKNNNYIQNLDLSGTAITGSIFKTLCLPSLNSLYLDFCQKLDSSKFGFDHFPNLRKLSIYGSDITMEPPVMANKRNISVIKTENNETENQIREYATKRGIRLTNWSITQKHMIKSQLPMLSQIYLTSMNDRI